MFRFVVLKRSLCIVLFVRTSNKPRCKIMTMKHVTVFKKQELIRWDSKRELFNDDIAHVLQNSKKRS